MFATRKARVRLRTALLAILIVAVSLGATYLTFVAKAYESYYYSKTAGYIPTSMPILASIMWLADIAITGILLYHLFVKVLPDREVPKLRKEVTQLRAQLAEFQDPPRAEVHGYVQPPTSIAGLGGYTVNPNHGAGE